MQLRYELYNMASALETIPLISTANIPYVYFPRIIGNISYILRLSNLRTYAALYFAINNIY